MILPELVSLCSEDLCPKYQSMNKVVHSTQPVHTSLGGRWRRWSWHDIRLLMQIEKVEYWEQAVPL